MYNLIGLAVVTQTAVVARSAPRVAGSPHDRGLRPEKVTYFVGTDEQAAVVHSRRQRGRAGASRRKPLGGRPRAIIRPSTTLNSVRKQQGIDAMRREQQAKGRAAPQALPTGKCEC